MYAILQQGGHQYRVAPGDRLLVDRLEAPVGSIVALEPVLLVQGDKGGPDLGAPSVDGARVAVLVISHRRGRKITVFKYKPKKRYRRTQGHRSHLTELRVEAVLAKGEPLPEAPSARGAKTDEQPAAATATRRPSRTRSTATEAAAPAAPSGGGRSRGARATAATATETETAATGVSEAEVPAPEAAPAPRRTRTRTAKPATGRTDPDTTPDTAGESGETEA